MNKLRVRAGPYTFIARLERGSAPSTCTMFEGLLPFSERVIHSRWSGEAVWIPLGDLKTGLEFENHTCHPSRGDFLLYPGGFSETEILFTYGSASFASKMGALAGNHFLTVEEGSENLEALGKLVLWQGAQEIVFERI
jgi:hypothetical protein